MTAWDHGRPIRHVGARSAHELKAAIADHGQQAAECTREEFFRKYGTHPMNADVVES
jgi:hypothetical protein